MAANDLLEEGSLSAAFAFIGLNHTFAELLFVRGTTGRESERRRAAPFSSLRGSAGGGDSSSGGSSKCIEQCLTSSNVFFTVIVGCFGMNLTSRLEADPYAFYVVGGLLVTVCGGTALLVRQGARRRGLL